MVCSLFVGWCNVILCCFWFVLFGSRFKFVFGCFGLLTGAWVPVFTLTVVLKVFGFRAFGFLAWVGFADSLCFCFKV